MKYFMPVFIASFFLCALMVYPLSAYAKDSVLDIREVTSKSGLVAWLVEDKSVPVIALNFSFRDAGSKTDPEGKQGLARIASNTMDEGAGYLDSQSFQKELNDLSITLGFTVSRDNFGGSVKTLTRNKARAFELLKMALLEPRFDEEPLGRMVASNKSRIKSSMGSPKWMAARLQNDRIFEGHPYALNSGGTLSSLDRITADDLRDFHKNLGRSDLVISAAGDITAEELAYLIDDVFADLPNIRREPFAKTTLKNAGKTYLYKQDIPQSIIAITQEGVGRDDPDYYSAKLMNFILGESGFGSRLMDEIREKRGLTYGIYSYFRRYDAVDILHISTSTANENTAEMISLIKGEWSNIKGDLVSDKELADAKSYLVGSLPLSLTSTNSIAAILLSLQMDDLPIDYLDQRKGKINSVTAQDIKNTANKVLNEDSFLTIIVGSPSDIIGAEEITTLPNVE